MCLVVFFFNLMLLLHLYKLTWNGGGRINNTEIRCEYKKKLAFASRCWIYTSKSIKNASFIPFLNQKMKKEMSNTIHHIICIYIYIRTWSQSMNHCRLFVGIWWIHILKRCVVKLIVINQRKKHIKFIFKIIIIN